MSEQQTHDTHPDHDTHRGGHGWLMIACCIPMLAIAVVLAATGVLSAGFLIFAVGCTAMMALMMGGMSHGKGDQGGSPERDGSASDAGGAVADQHH